MHSNLKTDWLARWLTYHPQKPIFYREPPKPSEAEIERETARLNALPQDEQITVFCDAMGFNIIQYLDEKSKFQGEVINEIEWLTIDAQD